MSGDHDTHRPAQRDDRSPKTRGLRERAHPDTRAGVQDVASLDVIVASGSRRFLGVYLGLIALMELCGTGRTTSPKHNQTRRQWNRRGSLSMSKQNGSTQPSIRTQNVFSTSTFTGVIGLTSRRRSFTNLLKFMSSMTLNFPPTARAS